MTATMDLFARRRPWPPARAARLPARTLAYVGDAVFELAMRLDLVGRGLDAAGRLHDSVVGLVNADHQARLFDDVFPTLPESEQALLKTWRNARMPHRTGGASRGAYARATAFEAWLGYLFLTGQPDRCDELLRRARELSGPASPAGAKAGEA